MGDAAYSSLAGHHLNSVLSNSLLYKLSRYFLTLQDLQRALLASLLVLQSQGSPRGALLTLMRLACTT